MTPKNYEFYINICLFDYIYMLSLPILLGVHLNNTGLHINLDNLGNCEFANNIGRCRIYFNFLPSFPTSLFHAHADEDQTVDVNNAEMNRRFNFQQSCFFNRSNVSGRLKILKISCFQYFLLEHRIIRVLNQS